MSATVQHLLNEFDALSDVEQHQVIVEILRRAERTSADELTDEALVAAADILFRALDEQEAADARPESR